MKRQLVIESICFLFIVLFLYAAGSKLTEYYGFIGQMSKSPLITNYAEYLAWAVPLVEIVVALMLIIPKTKLAGLYASFALMTTFTFYISAILTVSKELPCSCGGVLNSLGWRDHLLVNIGFVVLALVGIYLITTSEREQRGITPIQSPTV